MNKAGRVSIVPKGNFIEGTSYTRLDMVRYKGGVYVSIKDSIGISPENEEYWMFLLESYSDIYAEDSINLGRKADTTIGEKSSAMGQRVEASGRYSHAEGQTTKASGWMAHAEGNSSEATGTNSHAENQQTKATGGNSHAEGEWTEANQTGSHAEGGRTKANGRYSHSEGYYTEANSDYSHTGGYYTLTDGSNFCTAIGKYNVALNKGASVTNITGDAFIIGNGHGPGFVDLSGISQERSNAFSVMFDGTVKAAGTITGQVSADYAEFFEWLDGNPEGEDRVGKFVTLDGDKIRIANPNDYILGIVSGQPFVLGNGDCDTWNGMYLRDEFNRIIQEPAPLYKDEIDEKTGDISWISVLDEEGNQVYQGTRPVINPEYDQKQKYISRFDRPEWAPIGMLGVLSVYDDGTCQVNGYCSPAEGGIATASEQGYRVIKRVSDNIIRVVFK